MPLEAALQRVSWPNSQRRSPARQTTLRCDCPPTRRIPSPAQPRSSQYSDHVVEVSCVSIMTAAGSVPPLLRLDRASTSPCDITGQQAVSPLACLRVQYDIVSSGLGAMVCTSFFVSRGQDPWTALSITVASAVVALVCADS